MLVSFLEHRIAFSSSNSIEEMWLLQKTDKDLVNELQECTLILVSVGWISQSRPYFRIIRSILYCQETCLHAMNYISCCYKNPLQFWSELS